MLDRIRKRVGELTVNVQVLRALILEDLERFPDSPSKEGHRRVGPEIPDRTFRRALEALVENGQVKSTGGTRWRKYRLQSPLGHGEDEGR